MQIKDRGKAEFVLTCNFVLVKPGLHIVAAIAKHACDHILKMGLKALNISIANISYEI